MSIISGIQSLLIQRASESYSQALEAQKLVSASALDAYARRNLHMQIAEAGISAAKREKRALCWQISASDLLYRRSSIEESPRDRRLFVGIGAVPYMHECIALIPNLGVWTDGFGTHYAALMNIVENGVDAWWYVRVSEGGYDYAVPVWGVSREREQIAFQVPESFTRCGGRKLPFEFDGDVQINQSFVAISEEEIDGETYGMYAHVLRVENGTVASCDMPFGELPHHSAVVDDQESMVAAPRMIDLASLEFEEDDGLLLGKKFR